MPPKQAPDSGLTLTEANIKMLKATLRHVEAFKPDWKAVKADTGVGNPPRDFRELLKKLGLKLNDGVFSDDSADGATPAAATTKAKASKSTKKRGASAEEPDQTVPAKKAKPIAKKAAAKKGTGAKKEVKANEATVEASKSEEGDDDGDASAQSEDDE